MAQQADGPRSTGVTMLSGFLGAGKTTLLRYVLQNTTEKIGCIVNDVASVNIDAKLLRNDRRQGDADRPASTADLADTIELANGCACCSIADELFVSFENLMDLADKRGVPFDRIILENSGVAEPQNIRDQFNEAIATGHPLMQRIHLDSLVTVVDSHTFIADYSSRAPVAARPDLGEGGGMRPVVDLLVEQIECADYIILNKSDMLDAATRSSLAAIVASLNPLAQVVPCEFGKVPIEQVFGKEAQKVVANLNIEGQHRGAVAAARTLEQAEAEAKAAAVAAGEQEREHDGHKHHHHSHEHGHEHGEHEKQEHKHKQRKHSHEPDGHKHSDCKACEEGDKHAHHDHAEGDKHDHHDHEHHHHHHGHKHERQQTTAAKRFGIVSFVYERRRPFHPQRLKDLVFKWMPVSHNRTLKEGEQPETGDSPIRTVLRSKGFMWIANGHATAFYWSHAGQHFEIKDEGEWWAAVPEADWPQDPAQRRIIMADFDLHGSYGDRRQEIVFIGASMDRAAIEAQMDSALLTDKEMEQYTANYSTQPDPEHPEVEALRAAASQHKH